MKKVICITVLITALYQPTHAMNFFKQLLNFFGTGATATITELVLPATSYTFANIKQEFGVQPALLHK